MEVCGQRKNDIQETLRVFRITSFSLYLFKRLQKKSLGRFILKATAWQDGCLVTSKEESGYDEIISDTIINLYFSWL